MDVILIHYVLDVNQVYSFADLELNERLACEVAHNRLAVLLECTVCKMQRFESIDSQIAFVLDDSEQIVQSSTLISIMLFAYDFQQLEWRDSYVIHITGRIFVELFLDHFEYQYRMVLFQVSRILVDPFPLSVDHKVVLLVVIPQQHCTFVP